MTNKRGAVLPWLILGAVLTALTLIFPEVGILEWLTMIPLVLGAMRLCERQDTTLKRAFGYGFLTVYVFYVVIYHWIVNLYPLDFVGMDEASSAVVVALGWFGLPVLQGIVGGAIFWLFRLLYKTNLMRAPILRPFAFAALWVVFEWSSTLTWMGVPWGRLALGQVKLLPMLQSISYFGSYFVTFLIVAVNGLFALAVLHNRRAALSLSLAAVLFFGNFGVGLIKRSLPSAETGTKLTAAVIQGNIDSHEKWGTDAYAHFEKTYGSLTREAAEAGAELIVWPESVCSLELNQKRFAQRFVSELAQECKATILVGSFYGDEEDAEKYYNALYLVTPDGVIHDEVYAKQHLVPFGEYVPMRELILTLIPPLAELSALDNDVTPGESSALFETEWGKIGSLICFDSIYEDLSQKSVRDGAELMVISSNDNWFYDSAAVYQHCAQAQLRAIETGRTYLRAASTGISTVITPDGEAQFYIKPLTKGYALVEVSTASSQTLYTRIGNTFVYLCLAFCLTLLIPFGKRRIEE